MVIIKAGSVPPVLLNYTEDVAWLVEMVDAALHEVGLHAFITSGMDGTHKRASEHYAGRAVDFRINFTQQHREVFFKELTRRFGSRARYILETDHLHTEVI